MDRTLFPAYQMMNDYISNYTDGNIDDGNRLRALNRAIEDVHRRLGLTCDEKIFNFLYSQDNMFTDLTEDFDEPILLYYENQAYNLGGQSGWNWGQYTKILQSSGIGGSYGYGYGMGMYGQKTFGTTNINGTKQLVQRGANIRQGSTINAFNTLNLLTATGDATSLAVDNNIYVANGGSVSFTIDPNLGNGYAGIQVSGFGIMSVEQAIQNSGIYKVYSYLQTDEIDEIQLILTSSGGSYTFSVTTQQDNSAFEADAWNKMQFQWTLVSIAGSPDSQAITSYEFRWVEGAGFGSVAIPYFRIDDFYLTFPDEMNLIYYTQYKGTDSTGTVNKIILDNLSDKPTFMQFFPDFINMISLKAALILMPQMALDKEFMALYRRDYEESLEDWGKIYPRKRIVNSGQTILRRP